MEYVTNDVSGTEALASELGRRLRGGEVIELTSDLGGGKTSFVRGLARGLGSHDHVASPTFTISREYSAANGVVLHHYDFYRLGDDAGIMIDELHDVMQDPQRIIAVEWSGAVQDILPADRIAVHIKRLDENSRQLRFDYIDKAMVQGLDA